MPVQRLRDINNATFDGTALGCAQSVTVTLGSDVLRGRCDAAISDRYQGLTNLTAEVTVESADPFVDVHPGNDGILSFGIPVAVTGIPGPTAVTFAMFAVNTTHSGRVERNSLASGTYVFRGLSLDGIVSPFFGLGGILESAIVEPSISAATFIRDIDSFSFQGNGGAITGDDFCPQSFEFSENSELIEDSCQGKLWPEYVGITGLNLTASATGRGVKLAVERGGADNKGLGSKGQLAFSVLTGSDVDCVSLLPGGAVAMDLMNINEISFTASHGELAEVTISWTGHGSNGEIADESKRAIAVFI